MMIDRSQQPGRDDLSDQHTFDCELYGCDPTKTHDSKTYMEEYLRQLEDAKHEAKHQEKGL